MDIEPPLQAIKKVITIDSSPEPVPVPKVAPKVVEISKEVEKQQVKQGFQ